MQNMVGMKYSQWSLTSFVDCFGQIRQGADSGWGKNRSGVPFFKNGFLLQTSKATATNQMHSNDRQKHVGRSVVISVAFRE